VRIGVPKEIKSDEHRVALTPAGVRELVDRGHEIFVESAAGAGSAIDDDEYSREGATIVDAGGAWAEAELVLKVKEPIEAEYRRFREGLVLFTYLHLAADVALTDALLESGVCAVAYETVETSDGRLPLLSPMSEIAGRLATQAGAHFLEKPLGGRGLLLGGVPGVEAGRVVILGGGVVGYNAALIAIGLGAHVTLVDRSLARMRHLDQILFGRVSTVMSSALEIGSRVRDADVVIGAVLVPGARAPMLLTENMLGGMKPGAVIVDVAIDQGGCVETARPTTHSDPVYEVEGIVHYCVANMPGGVPVTSTRALTNATLPYVEAIADSGLAEAISHDRALQAGVNIMGGRVTYRPVADAHGLDFTPLGDLLRRK
jgi:alanine dehydrogenase